MAAYGGHSGRLYSMFDPIPFHPRGRPPGPHPGRGSYTPGKLMWWHDAIIDQMLANPHLTKREIAVILGKTPQFIYRVTGSDLFQARYAARRAEYEAALGVDLVAKVNRVAAKSLDLILEQLESKGTITPIGQLESLADKTLSRLGYGQRRADPPPVVNVSGAAAVQVVVPATREELDAARRLISGNERQLSEESRSDSALATAVLAEGLEACNTIEGSVTPDPASGDGR